MQQTKFNIGDPVRLTAAGSRPMTVAGTSPDGDVLCEWIDDKGQPQSHAYKAAMLRLDGPEPGGHFFRR